MQPCSSGLLLCPCPLHPLARTSPTSCAATRTEYASLKAQLQSEAFPPAQPGGASRVWTDLSQDERGKLLKDRLKKYCQKVGRGAGHGLGGSVAAGQAAPRGRSPT